MAQATSLNTTRTGFSNVWVLALISAISLAAFSLIALMGSILGAQLAPDETWASLPIALMVIGTACGVLPVAKCMSALSRKPTFLLFMTLGMVACLLAGQSLKIHSFSLFCFSTFLLGITNAAMAQIRFAAMESVSLEQGTTAVSIIMCAGIVAAFLGPELALIGRHTTAIEYRGSFWLAGVCLFTGALLLALFYRATPPREGKQDSTPRPLRAMLSSPSLLLAIGSGAAAYMVMSLIMTAAPISMHLHHGYSIENTKWVIQSHIAAMFLPSLTTIWLFKILSIKGLMVAGLSCFTLTIGIGLVDASVMGYWGQLVMLGIGWNFLFVSGTALLPTAHHTGEHYRAQALNDSVIFTTQAIAALSAGWAISVISWQSLLLICLLPMTVIAAMLFSQRKSS